MSGRLPMCEQPGIAERMAEIQRERVAAIAGCRCLQRTTEGLVVHVAACPLRPAAPSQMQATLEAMARARARLRQAGVPIREDDAVAAAERFVELSAKMKRRPVDGRRFEGEPDGSCPSPSPAPDYGDLALARQPHPSLVAGRESGLAPGSFPRSRP